jgi:hypothetical protein
VGRAVVSSRLRHIRATPRPYYRLESAEDIRREEQAVKLDGWHSVSSIARMAWLQGAAWCALNFSPAGTGGVTGALWAVTGALVLRLTTLAPPGRARIARATGFPKA